MTDAPSTSGMVSSTHEQTEDRDNRVTTVAWMVGIVGVCAVGCIDPHMSFGAGLGITAIAAMVAYVAVAILKLK